MAIEMKEFKVHAPGGVSVAVPYEVSEIVTTLVTDYPLQWYSHEVSDRVQGEINLVPGAFGWTHMPIPGLAGAN